LARLEHRQRCLGLHNANAAPRVHSQQILIVGGNDDGRGRCLHCGQGSLRHHIIGSVAGVTHLAAILFDKFHIMRHLGEALDKVRKAEYARLRGKDRRFVKGQKYTLLSHRDNLTLDGKRSLALLLAANKRLNTAYLLKEAFGQLWSYRREGWARRFFDNWRASLKWQRLKPYERFADMIDRHWDGIAAYCKPENKVSLGFVEGLNNKIRVFQRRAYGLKDEEYLRLKVLSCMLPVL
jgi:transposase